MDILRKLCRDLLLVAHNICPAVSLKIPHFTISVYSYGSSYYYIFFGIILAHLLSLSLNWVPRGREGCQAFERD